MRVVFSFILILLMPVAFSQEDSSKLELDEVVITAQRSTQKELYTPYSIKSIGQQYLREINPRTTPEALIGINGVFVQKTNHGGGSPIVRGLTGNQTLILVDGVRLNNSTFRYGPNQYLNTVDAYTINRIEVARGTGSVQYGTDAIGGVIHVITKEPELITGKHILQGRFTGKYMTGNMEGTGRGDMSYSSKQFAFTGGIAYRHFGDLIGGDTTGKQSPSGYNQWSFDAKAKIGLQKNMQLTLAHQFLQQRHVPVYHKVKLENFSVNEFDPQQRALSYARLNIQGVRSLVRKVEIIASWQQTAEGRSSLKNGSSILRKERDGINTAGLTIDVFSQVSNAWTGNSGIELYYDKVKSVREETNIESGITHKQRGLYPNNSSYGNYSMYTLHHLQVKKWTIDGGLRFNTFNIRISDTTLGRVNIKPGAVVGNFGVLYTIRGQHNVYATFSNGYRAPNIDDMGTLGIVDFRYELPASDLRPEKSGHVELGYKFRSGNLRGTFAAYYMQLNNLITRIKVDGSTINGYPVYKKENTEQAYIRGFETELNWQAFKTLQFSVSTALTYGQNKTANEPLRRIPPFNGRLLSTWRHQQWFACFEWMFAGKQDRLAKGDKDDNRIPVGGTPGWNLINLYTGYQLPSLKVNAGLQNIFNEDYRTHGSGINGYGRSLWLQIMIYI